MNCRTEGKGNPCGKGNSCGKGNPYLAFIEKTDI